MNTAYQQAIRRERLEYTVNLAEGIADFVIATTALVTRAIEKTAVALEEMGAYLPRSQA